MHMIPACPPVITGVSVDDETIRCGCVKAHAQAAIFA
jgi:hypothetical protein